MNFKEIGFFFHWMSGLKANIDKFNGRTHLEWMDSGILGFRNLIRIGLRIAIGSVGSFQKDNDKMEKRFSIVQGFDMRVD